MPERLFRHFRKIRTSPDADSFAWTAVIKNVIAMDFEIIETNRLILKGISPELMKRIFEQCEKSEIKTLLGHRSEEDYLKEEYKHKNGYSSYNRSFMLFLLTEKGSGSIIGRCGIHNWNADHRRAEIGYVMEQEESKRRGLMTEALEAVIEFGFNKMKLNRLEALVGAGNVASLRLLEKFNFKPEGRLRSHYNNAGKFEDSLLFSRLYEEHNAEKTNAGSIGK
jgi:[ribosomal protein S5]-alanine N-acetyltransferase